jgi:hypothetical protein
MARANEAPRQESKDADGVVVISNDVGFSDIGVGWIRFLEMAVSSDGEYELVLGKCHKPPIREGTTIYLMRAGHVCCALPAGELRNTYMGWVIVFRPEDVRKARGVAIATSRLAERWALANGRRMPASLWFMGWRSAWWKVEDESEPALQAWTMTDVSADAAIVVRALVEQWSKARGAHARPGLPSMQPSTPAQVSVAQRGTKKQREEYAGGSGGISGVVATKVPVNDAGSSSSGQGNLFG